MAGKKSIFDFENEEEMMRELERMLKEINSDPQRKRLYEILANL